jgi:hypothetical protein
VSENQSDSRARLPLKPTSGYVPKGNGINMGKDNLYVYCSTIPNSQDVKSPQKSIHR